MLVGRSLEINGNIYSRLMVESPLGAQNPAYRLAFLLFYKWVIDNKNYISTQTQK